MPDEDSERWVSYNLSDLYPDWQDQAHCAGVGVEYYFGADDEKLPASIKRVRRAAKLCEVCPVFIECLTWALTKREEYGVWAGTSGRVRRKIYKMVDNGETTVPEVVEEFRNGRGHTYRLGTSSGQEGHENSLAEFRPQPVGARASGLRDETGREAAI